MTKPIILFRRLEDNREELSIASRYCEVYDARVACPPNSVIIGRYSVLPFYRELVYDLMHKESSLINSYNQHQWIANFDYYDCVSDYTFKTWTDQDFRLAPEGRYVVKGRTNSRKDRWSTHMFAASKRDALIIASELWNDSLIGPQGVLYREYVPLETYECGINGLPFANEWRFFFLRKDLLCYGYYWSNAQMIPDSIEPKAVKLAQEIAGEVAEHVNFFVLDLAKTMDGEWKLVEINDGQMSGLSCCKPEELYIGLAKAHS